LKREKLIVIGSGRHTKVVVDVLQELDVYELVGCIGERTWRDNLLGVPVVGESDILPKIRESGVSLAFVAIGDNQNRLEMAQRARSLGFSFVNAVSPHARLSKHVKLGTGIAIMPGVVVNVDTAIGDHAIINTGSTIDHDCEIGEAAHIAPGCHLAGTVKIGTGAFLGIGSKVIPNTPVGEWTTVGGGSIVIRELPSHAVAVGVPAKVIKMKAQS
jgi:UDP-perosamine 4-acetyltransferase